GSCPSEPFNPPPTWKARLPLFLAAPMAMAFGQAGQHQLRYEWAATPEGPFKAVPREMIRGHADGTATVVSSESRGFFRLLFDGGTGGASVPIRPLDSVPAATLDMLNKFIAA